MIVIIHSSASGFFGTVIFIFHPTVFKHIVNVPQ